MLESSPPKYIGTMKSDDGETLAELRVQLEEKKILNFPFQYWDPQGCCRMVVTLESLNDVEDSVFMILVSNQEEANPMSLRQSPSCGQELQDCRQINDVEEEQTRSTKRQCVGLEEEIPEEQVHEGVAAVVPKFLEVDTHAPHEFQENPPSWS